MTEHYELEEEEEEELEEEEDLQPATYWNPKRTHRQDGVSEALNNIASAINKLAEAVKLTNTLTTLHDLTREEGHDTVAASIGITPRALTNKRAGINPLTIDDLYRLSIEWPDFDMVRTIDRLGRKRAQQ